MIVAGWRGEAGGLPRFDRTGRYPLRSGYQSGGRTSAFSFPGRGRNYTPGSGHASWARCRAAQAVRPGPINHGRDHERARRNRQEKTPAEAKGGAHKTSRADASGPRAQGQRPANHPGKRDGRGRRRATSDKHRTPPRQDKRPTQHQPRTPCGSPPPEPQNRKQTGGGLEHH